jgi:hypothetical protein
MRTQSMQNKSSNENLFQLHMKTWTWNETNKFAQSKIIHQGPLTMETS